MYALADDIKLLIFQKENRRHLQALMEMIEDPAIYSEIGYVKKMLEKDNDGLVGSHFVEINEEIIGVCRIKKICPEIVAIDLGIKEKSRNKGYAKKLFPVLERKIFEEIPNLKGICLIVSNKNIPSLKLIKGQQYQFDESLTERFDPDKLGFLSFIKPNIYMGQKVK